MKAGDKVIIGGTTFIVLKMVKLKENIKEYSEYMSEYIQVGETYPVILESDVNGNYMTYLIMNRKHSKQYFDSNIFDEVIE